MKKLWAFLFSVISFSVVAQNDSIPPGVYTWTQQGNTFATVLMNGNSTSMEHLKFSGYHVSSKGNNRFHVPENEERLLIIRSGTFLISLRDSSIALSKGSIALILPNQDYGVKKEGSADGEYYEMKYTSRTGADQGRGNSAGSSFVKDWNAIPFKPHDKGGIRNFFNRPTAMSPRFEMHVTTLNAGLKSHDPHRHIAEEIVLVLEGDTEMQIEDKFYKGREGSVYFLPSNKSHAIRNAGNSPATYFAFQFE